ncbi:MAG: septal ring lytic transglycosylase RlpA family protein [Alphaproteobacteria bacterium]
MKIPGGIHLRRIYWLSLTMLLPACSLQLPFVTANADQPTTTVSAPIQQAAPNERVIETPPQQQFATLPARPIAKPRFRTIPPRLQITGYASWYGIPFHGRITANGEVYDMNALSAAHKTLPFGTRVRITNLDNGSTLVLRINDRGPYVEGRVIDVSRRAARLLGFQHAGLANVHIVLEPTEQTARR